MNRDDLGVVNQSVNQGHHARRIGKDLGPFGKGLVGRDDGALLLMPTVDQFKQQVGMAVGVRQVTDLVHAQQIGGRVLTQSPA